MARMLGNEFMCRDCGSDVVWCESKAGKKYLGVVAQLTYEFGVKTLLPRHECQPDPDWRARYEADIAELARVAAAEGRIVKGVHVRVVKGRKVPIGTTGTIFWVAEEEDRFGVIKCGFTTAEGDKHFTNIKNLEVAQ